MATIIPFPAQRTCDWSESERARLNELAARFADQAGIEVVFGRSDSGDPWCVILDAQDEVLAHVARVKGSFIAHTLASDVFAQADDLRSVVERALGAKWQEERFDVVVPFAAGNRQAQIIAAAIVVTSFVYHHRVDAAMAGDWALADLSTARSGMPAAKLLQRDEAAKLAYGTELWDAAQDWSAIGPATLSVGAPDLPAMTIQYELADTPVARRMKLSLMDEATAVLERQAAIDDVPSLRLDAPVAVPPGGAAKRGGEPELYHGLVEGGEGNDLLVLDHGVFAIGGDGADNFSIRAPETSTAAKATPLLGVIVDFSPGVDNMTTAGSLPLNIVSTVPVQNVLADPNINLSNAPVLIGERIGVDFDGDDLEDGYLLVGNVNGNDMALVAALKAAILSPSGTAPDLPIHAQPESTMIVPANEVI